MSCKKDLSIYDIYMQEWFLKFASNIQNYEFHGAQRWEKNMTGFQLSEDVKNINNEKLV